MTARASGRHETTGGNMSEKKTLIELEERRQTYMAGMLLKEVAAALSRRELEICADGQTHTLAVPAHVDVEYSVKQKPGEGKTKLKIEISWKS